MSEEIAARRDFARPLFYSSLVVAGLLVGVLVTLWLTQPEAEQTYVRPTVETARLGSGGVFPNVVLPETLSTRGYVDALTLNEAFKTVSAFVRPSVVFVQVESGSPGGFLRGRGGFSQSAGSGVIVSADGYVVTNHHVIEDASRIRVVLSDKREFLADVIGDDPNTDLAVLKLQTDQPVPAIDLGDSERLQVGEWVLAVGNPFRLTSTVTAGIVSALGRQVDIIDDSFGIESFIQTDAAINPGNSGGALVNLRGQLVGIATAIATESGNYEGYGFAVPVRLVDRVMRDLIEFGEVQRGYLGVDIWPIDSERANQLGLPDIQGVLLNNVYAGLAADLAGLRSGDVLLEVDGKPVFEPNELQTAIAMHRPGEALDVQVWRDGLRRSISVELFGRDNPTTKEWFAQLDLDRQPDGRPAEPESPPHGQVVDVPGWGMGLFELTDRFQSLFDVEQGAYVAYVESEGSAFESGLGRNVVIVSVDGEAVSTPQDVIDRLTSGDGPFVVEALSRGGQKSFFEMSR